MGVEWLRFAWERERERERARGSLVALAIALGCMPELEPELGEFVARGEHVEVWASEGLEVCGGNVEHMDRFVDRFREVVGPRPEAEAVHRYYADAVGLTEWVGYDFTQNSVRTVGCVVSPCHEGQGTCIGLRKSGGGCGAYCGHDIDEQSCRDFALTCNGVDPEDVETGGDACGSDETTGE